MDQPLMTTEAAVNMIHNWYFREDSQQEKTRDMVREETVELEKQRKLFKKEQEEFYRTKELEEKHLEHQKNLFDMKWKILEEEWRKLVIEQEKVERKKQFYSRMEEFERSQSATENISVSEFFCGVKSKSALKKRYKDLIKIFHPDNLSGDTVVIQKINQEYEDLKKNMAG